MMASSLQHSRQSTRNLTSSLGLPTPILRPKFGRSRPMTAATWADFFDNDVICAVSEARGISPTIGLSFINLSTSEAVLCQLSDTQTFARTCHKLAIFSPSEIVFATTAANSKLVSVIRENLNTEVKGIKMTAIDRRYWSEVAGQEYIHLLAIASDLDSLRLSIASNHYAVCCFAAAMKYVDNSIGFTYVPQSLRIRSEPSEGAMMIDASTLASLEIVQNALDSRSKHSLFGLLNQTRTGMGARFLKSNILQPSTDKMKLLARYEAVAELTANENVLLTIRQALSGFVDVDRLLAALVIIENRIDLKFMEQSVNLVIMLKSIIDRLMPVWQSLSNATSKELQAIRQLCAPLEYSAIQELLQYTLNEDVRFSSKPTELRNQRIWALNAGVNGFLDVARQTYSEINQDVGDLMETLKGQHDLNLELKYDSIRHYFISIKSSDLEDNHLPEIFVNTYHKKGKIECQTMDLVKLNQRLDDAHNEVLVISDQSIQELINHVRTELHPLFKISEALSLLDMISTFAEASIKNNYVQPELTSTLAIESGRHPLREVIQREPFVPNDVYASQQSRFQIITGCNMSGKSTYIRFIALMAVMAQIGCFVPADYASFPIMHQLFARVSTDDSIEENASSFASEMRDMAFILHNIEPRSIVLVDELGRGTSTNDGLAIAIAISEALIESKAMVWFATHFRDLPRILAERAGVVSLHLTVDIEPELSVMKMRYKIADGPEEQKHYGLALAKVLNLPTEIIDEATSVSQRLNKRVESQRQHALSLIRTRKRNLVLKLKEQLDQARESNIEEDNLKQWLKRLQEEFAIRLNALEIEATSTIKSSCEGNEMLSSHVDMLNCTDPELASESLSDELLLPRTPSPVFHSRQDTNPGCRFEHGSNLGDSKSNAD